MIEKKIVIHLKYGLQNRNATEFVQLTSSYKSEITIIKNERSVAGKSITGVMAIATREGEEITLIVDGSDEQEAIVSLEAFLSSKK